MPLDGGQYELQVIVCQAGGEEEETRVIESCSRTFEFEQVSRVRVSAHSAFSQEQFAEWNKVWPMTFHEPRLREKDFKDFKLEERERIRLAIDKVGEYGAVILDQEFRMVCFANSTEEVHPLKHAALNAIDQFCILKDHKEQYLCTDMSILLLNEPCVFCCMALVHSRFKSVFYYLPKTECFSKMKIHENGKLNHHYVVYKIEKMQEKEEIETSESIEEIETTE
jgi:tRNA(Arg) A34 adenosine deaminase TadA